MSDNFRRDVRRERAETGKSRLVAEAVTKLEAIGSVRPDAAQLVKIAVDVVKSAAEEIAIAEGRAEAAETLVSGVRPHLDQLEAENAALAEENAALESQLAAAREIAAADATEKAAVAKSIDVAAEIGQIAAGIAQIKAAQEALPHSPEFQLVKAIHACTRDQDGQSAIVNRSEYASGPWEVVDVDGAVIEVLEKRSSAIALVKQLLEAEMKAAESHDDALDSPRAARRKKQPGEVHSDKLPDPPAAVDHGPSKSARKRPRIF